MKERDVIEKLKMLNCVAPSGDELESIKRKVFYRIQMEKRQSSFFRPVLFYGAFALAVFLLVLTVSITPLSSVVEKAYVISQIQLAQNKYQKATIAFGYTQGKLANLKNSNNQLSALQIEDLLQSTYVANTQLASLNLVGEAGKYTSSQCREIYKKYYNYLEEAQKTIASGIVKSGDNNSEELLKRFNTGLELYEQQAKEKLNRY